MKNFDWSSYMDDYVKGIRLYLLKDDLSSLEEAKRKCERYTNYKTNSKIKGTQLFLNKKILHKYYAGILILSICLLLVLKRRDFIYSKV